MEHISKEVVSVISSSDLSVPLSIDVLDLSSPGCLVIGYLWSGGKCIADNVGLSLGLSNISHLSLDTKLGVEIWSPEYTFLGLYVISVFNQRGILQSGLQTVEKSSHESRDYEIATHFLGRNLPNLDNLNKLEAVSGRPMCEPSSVMCSLMFTTPYPVIFSSWFKTNFLSSIHRTTSPLIQPTRKHIAASTSNKGDAYLTNWMVINGPIVVANVAGSSINPGMG